MLLSVYIVSISLLVRHISVGKCYIIGALVNVSQSALFNGSIYSQSNSVLVSECFVNVLVSVHIVGVLVNVLLLCFGSVQCVGHWMSCFVSQDFSGVKFCVACTKTPLAETVNQDPSSMHAHPRYHTCMLQIL